MKLKTKAYVMRLAINDVELALSCDPILRSVEILETASDEVLVKVPLGVLRQLARSYPALNRIVNSSEFNFSGLTP